jgi:hypothetical protein
MNEFNFGPKTSKEEIIFAEEAARVDREVAEYEGTWRCRYNQMKAYLRERYWNWIDNRDSIGHWLYLRARGVKLLYQRVTRGWDDSVTWSLDIHLAGLILPRLKRFRELNVHGYPNGFTPESWHATLDKMIFAFEYTIDEDRMFGKFDEAEYERAKEGLRLFGEYFHALWD